MKRHLLILFALVLIGCKTTQPVPTQTRDSVRIEYRLDSVYIWQHDSIFRDRWRNGDTVFVTVEKWQVKWRDKVVQVHDTVRTNEVQVQTVQYTPKWKNTCVWLFFILLILIAARIGFKVYKRLIML